MNGAMADTFFDFFLSFQGPVTYLLIFTLLVICGLGLPLPEDITLIGAGLLVYYGEANLHMMIIVSLVGVILGDTVIFLLGGRYGNSIRKKYPFNKVLNEQRYRKSKLLIKKWGNKLIFAARFMPGLRAPIFFTSGTLHLPYFTFIFYNGLAAIISVPAIIYSVWYFGGELEKVLHIIKRVEYTIAILIVLLFTLVVVYYKRKKKKKEESS